ncbi:MAG: endonuclease V [Thermoplasmata archaeon]
MICLAVDFPEIDLVEEVKKLVAQVPRGRITTYGMVARALGDISASRFVGKVMSENDDIVRVPCRRVVQSDGTIGGYTGDGGVEGKKRLLRAEGIEIQGDRILNFDKVVFDDFKTTYPLRKFRQIQKRDLAKIVLRDDYSGASMIAGSDVAYRDDIAYGALALFDRKSGDMIDVVTKKTKVHFPYIPTYLTFREAEVVSELVRKAGEDIILVHDGNGILHPLGFGVASHLGVITGVPSIGVAKKLLIGDIVGRGPVRKVMISGRHVGFAVSRDSDGAPVFVSPGHRVSVRSALRLLKPFWVRRVPEPVRIAHIEAEKARREDE